MARRAAPRRRFTVTIITNVDTRTVAAQVCGENQQSAINKPILNDFPRSQCVHGNVCMSACNSLGLSAGHRGGSGIRASVIWLADQDLFIPSVTETHLEETRFIWTLLSVQPSQESYNQTGISFMPSG